VSLTDEQLDRYARHIVLKEIGGRGQKALLEASIAIVGVGGVGCPAIQYLAAAGIGRLRLLDEDVVSLDNLQRQVLFGSEDVGRAKVDVAAEAVRRLNSDVIVDPRRIRIDRSNVESVLGGVDLVLDGCDNFATRLLVSDFCTAARIPLVSAAVGQFQVQVGTWRGWEPGRPCYRCFVGDAFDAEDCDTCAELGVLGATAGIAGSWAALEAVRQIVGFGDDAAGKVHVFDGLGPGLRTMRIAKDPGCRTCGGLGDQPR
jgi:adenylyltransferase/sulfurtransferase